MAITFHGATYAGVSGDTKPSSNLSAGDLFVETNTVADVFSACVSESDKSACVVKYTAGADEDKFSNNSSRTNGTTC